MLAVVGFFVRATYPNYDSYYALSVGQGATRSRAAELRGLPGPDRASTRRFFRRGVVPFGDGADRIFVLLTLLCLLRWPPGTYWLGRICFTPFVGAIAAFLVLTRFDFPSLAVRAYIDIPFMAMVVWAGALEAARPRRGEPVFVLLAAAGLMRPDAWLSQALYFLWMSWRASWAERRATWRSPRSVPCVWATTDFVVTGDPLFSLNFHHRTWRRSSADRNPAPAS